MRPILLDWSDEEVVARWARVYGTPTAIQMGLQSDASEAQKARAAELIQIRRERLADLSWFMKCLNEHIARRANAEDRCTGSFWEGRYKSQALLDERALITCMSYADLNPIRAGIAHSLGESDYTSIQQPIEAVQGDTSPIPLARFRDEPVNSKWALPFYLRDYLELVDWSGRMVLPDKQGAIAGNLPKILDRISFDQATWLQGYRLFGGKMMPVVGPADAIRRAATGQGSVPVPICPAGLRGTPACGPNFAPYQRLRLQWFCTLRGPGSSAALATEITLETRKKPAKLNSGTYCAALKEVSMSQRHLRARHHLSAIYSVALLGLFSATASAQFHDNGFYNPKVRTDYLATNEGTFYNRLFVGNCLYPNNSDPILLGPGCNAPPKDYWTQSNFFSQNYPGSRYWVISANNENHQSQLNTGPPNQSAKIFIPQPAKNLMEFTLLTRSLPGELAWRAHMIVDHTPNASQNPLGAFGIPFLGLGADGRRGNGANVGALQGPGSSSWNTTTFTARIWDKIHIDGVGAALMYVYAFSQWPNASGQMVPRGAFIQLYHEGSDTSSQQQNVKGTHKHWNWRYDESFFSPGADLAFVDAEDVSWACNGTTSVTNVPPNNSDRTVSVNWNKIFRCMSDNGLFDNPMPQGYVPLLGVHWAVEVAGANNALWASVHNMRMQYTSNKAASSGDGNRPVIPPGWHDPTTTAAIRAHFWEACLSVPQCREHNLEQFLGHYRDLDYAALNQPIGVARDLFAAGKPEG